MISDVVEFSEREHLHKFVLFDTILLNIIAIISSICLKIILLRLIASVKPLSTSVRILQKLFQSNKLKRFSNFRYKQVKWISSRLM